MFTSTRRARLRLRFPSISASARPAPARSWAQSSERSLYTKTKRRPQARMSARVLTGATWLVVGGGLVYILYRNDYVQPLPATRPRSSIRAEREKLEAVSQQEAETQAENAETLSALPYQVDGAAVTRVDDSSAWSSFSTKFAAFSTVTDIQWGSMADTIVDFVLPEWARTMPEYISKLQRELSMAPGSLADAIWQEARDPDINPEIERDAIVRISDELCDEEKDFLAQRRKMTRIALAKYLGLPLEEVHEDDVPTIAMVGSGGGLRALVAGTGSFLAASEDGLWDCITYTAGVSGSCWLQALFHSSLGQHRMDRMVDHLKARLGVHIAYPPVALTALNSAPTNKFLLSGVVEKLEGDPTSDFGLVDVYGLLLAARLLVPKGEVGVDNRDLKLSSQRMHLLKGEHPMPIYTTVRHEIPIIEESSAEEKATGDPSEETKAKAKREAWFQWFEITPFEMFCEEFGAGIPTWSIGRRYENGISLPNEDDGLYVPELRLPLLLGVFGSAFCATLSHYYKEVRPLVKSLWGAGGIDDMIEGRNEDLSKVHPIDPASMPNFAYKMDNQLAETTPESIYKDSHLKFMDAGMSNNLPIYPLLRPGRDVDIMLAFDASADVKQDNWLSVADGYARQRGIKGWPVGVGWPKDSDPVEDIAAQLDDAQADSHSDAGDKIEDAKAEQAGAEGTAETKTTSDSRKETKSNDLGYCTVWVGTTEERSSSTSTDSPPPSKAVQEDWELMTPDAGITIIYCPFLPNPRCPGVDPATSDYMSTWNFVYTPQDVDNVVDLARRNFEEGRERIRRTIRAVYERRKRRREEAEEVERRERFRRKVRLGIVGRKGEDPFHLT